jgi:Zn-finger nucleic acid-binding protein
MNQVLQCPKCHGAMRTYDRNGVHIEQCDRCRGIFLDYGEMEALTRMESQWVQQAPPQYGHGQPAWGTPHQGHHKHKSFGKMLFSS